MDKELFRLILLVVGVALVATVYYWDRLRGLFSQRPAASGRKRAPARQEPVTASTEATPGMPAAEDATAVVEEEVFDSELGELEVLIRAEEPVDVLLQDLPPPQTPDQPSATETDDADETPRPEPARPPAPPQQPAPPQILAVTLVATGGSISGIRLRRVLTDHGLGLGSRGLFERIGEEGRPLYCAANLVEPGIFDPLTLDGVSTPGLVLFQALEGSADHVAVFDAMLETANRLADRLDCTLCDSRRERLGEDGITALRTKAEQAGDQAVP
jgi:FtsZ-interacting cell division protein ZipA